MPTPDSESTPHTFRAELSSDEVKCRDCGAGVEMAEIACPTPGTGKIQTLGMSPDYARYLQGEISSEDYARRLLEGPDGPEPEPDPDWHLE